MDLTCYTLMFRDQASSPVPVSRAARVGLAVLAIVVALGACDLFAPDPPYGFLEFEAVAAVEGDTIRYALVIGNTSSEDVVLEYGGCIQAAALIVYEGPGPGHRRWDERTTIEDVPGQPRVICQPTSGRISVPAYSSATVSRQRAVLAILGDSLPDGPYRVSVTPWFSRDRGPVGPEVPAGEVILSR